MLQKFKKKYETISHIRFHPRRDCRLESQWVELGEGDDPCKPYGDGVLLQRRIGDIAPFFSENNKSRSLLTRLNRIALDQGGEDSLWADSAVEEARKSLIAAHEANDGDGDPELVEKYLELWLEAISELEAKEGLRNRIFPRVWRADRFLSRLSQGERSIRQSLGEEAWSWANWNALNFWCLPRPERLAENEKLQDALGVSISSEGRSSIAPAIERTRNRSVLWVNSTNFHGTLLDESNNPTQTPDLYGSETGSATVEFWINPRSPVDALGPGCILHIPGLWSLALLPWGDAVGANATQEGSGLDGDQRYRLGLFSEAALFRWLDDPSNASYLDAPVSNPGLGINPDILEAFLSQKADESSTGGAVVTPNQIGSASLDNGWISSAPSLQRGRWSHCVLRFDASRRILSLSINGELNLTISTEEASFTDPNNPENGFLDGNAWWRRIDVEDLPVEGFVPEYLCVGARQSLTALELQGSDPVTHPSSGDLVPENEWSSQTESTTLYGDPLNAEIHGLRIWGAALSLEALEQRKGGLLDRGEPESIATGGNQQTGEGALGEDPLERFLLFDAPLTLRQDCPPRPRATLNDWFEVREESLPYNYVWAGERGDVVSNAEGYLRDSVNDNWAVTTHSLSERTAIPSTGAWGGSGIESSDLAMSLFGIRNSLLVPLDNPDVRPSRRFIRDAREGAGDLRLGSSSALGVLLGADEILPKEEGQRIQLEDSASVSSLREASNRASTFTELQSIYYGERIVPETFTWEANGSLEWLLACLDSQAPLETVGTPLPEGIKFNPNPNEAGAYVEALRDNPALQRWTLRVAAIPDPNISLAGAKASPGAILYRSEVPIPERQDEREERDARGEDISRNLDLGYAGKGLRIGGLDTANGLAVLHHPCFWRLGEKTLKLRFDGERHGWTREWLLPLPTGELASRNPSWEPAFSSEGELPQNSTLPLLGAENNVALTDVILYDKNLNALIKTKMAQPIYRQAADRAAVKVKVDF